MEEYPININPNELSSKRLARDLIWTLWVSDDLTHQIQDLRGLYI